MRYKSHKAKPPRRGRFNVRTRVGAICLLSTTFLIPISPAAGGMAEGLAAYRAGDYTAAHAEWLPLAREGAAAAQRNVGQLYRLGQGVPRDAAVAANWYRLAAEQGLARAQSNLAAMYLQGDGVEKNAGVAAEWFRRAAAQGHALSQFNLGLMYETGFGLGVSLVKARSWYELAAGAGNARARDRLADLRNAPAKDDVALLPPARAAAGPDSSLPDRGARGLIMPPADPDIAREAELTKVRIAVAQVLRERAAMTPWTDKTQLPPPPFARADARAGQRPAEIVATEIVQADATVRKPLPDFLRHEAESDTGVAQFKPLPGFLVAEARRDKPVPDFLRQEAKNGTGALKFKPLPQFLAEEARHGGQEITVAAAPPPTAPVTATITMAEVEQKALPPLPRRRPLKPIPEFLKREAKEPVRLVAAVARPPARKPAPPAPRIAGAEPLPVPLPPFLRGEAKEDRARQFALNVKPDFGPGADLHLYVPQAAPAEAENVPGSDASPVPNFLRLEAAHGRATELAPESLALASGVLTSEAAPPVPLPTLRAHPPVFKKDAKEERAARFALKEKPEPLVLRARVSESGAAPIIDAKPIPGFLVREAKQTRRSLVADLARSLRAVLRPARNVRAVEIIPPTSVKPVPDILKREATENRRRVVAALADARTGQYAPTALITDARSTAQASALGDGASEKVIPEFLRREVRGQREAAAAAKPVSDFLKLEALLDGANFGAFKPVPAFIRREAAGQALVLASAGAKPVPDIIRQEAKLGLGARTFTMRRGPKGATIVRASLVNAGPSSTGSNAPPVPVHIKFEAALEARFVNASPPPPARVRASLPVGPEARTRFPGRDERPTEPRSAVILKAAARESDGGPLWLGEPERQQALSGRVVEAGITAYGVNDFTRAYDLWLAVARRGNANAQFLVGGLYADGTGVPPSLGRAYRWWRLSAGQGHTRAQELLPTLLGLMDEGESVLAEGAVDAT